jgi:hypothetical protein
MDDSAAHMAPAAEAEAEAGEGADEGSEADVQLSAAPPPAAFRKRPPPPPIRTAPPAVALAPLDDVVCAVNIDLGRGSERVVLRRGDDPADVAARVLDDVPLSDALHARALQQLTATLRKAMRDAEHFSSDSDA